MGRLGVLLSGGAASAFQRIELKVKDRPVGQFTHYLRIKGGSLPRSRPMHDASPRLTSKSAFPLFTLHYPTISCLNDRRVRTGIAFRPTEFQCAGIWLPAPRPTR